MSIREAMVRRVLGEKWFVIMILIPASEKDSWWGYADSSSSTISTDGFLWWFAVGHTCILSHVQENTCLSVIRSLSSQHTIKDMNVQCDVEIESVNYTHEICGNNNINNCVINFMLK